LREIRLRDVDGVSEQECQIPTLAMKSAGPNTSASSSMRETAAPTRQVAHMREQHHYELK
jgi:hypothetical protein